MSECLVTFVSKAPVDLTRASNMGVKDGPLDIGDACLKNGRYIFNNYMTVLRRHAEVSLCLHHLCKNCFDFSVPLCITLSNEV